MRERDKNGRLVNPFALVNQTLDRSVRMSNAFYSRAKKGVGAAAIVGDATNVTAAVEGQVDAVITSPPYHGAVDYYRRHQLEMFWLGEVTDQADRLELLHRYIGRPNASSQRSSSTDHATTPRVRRSARDELVTTRTLLAEGSEGRAGNAPRPQPTGCPRRPRRSPASGGAPPPPPAAHIQEPDQGSAGHPEAAPEPDDRQTLPAARGLPPVGQVVGRAAADAQHLRRLLDGHTSGRSSTVAAVGTSE